MAHFTYKVVIITGAASGLGLESAVRIASEGADLVLVDLKEDALEAAKALVLGTAPEAKILTVAADVSDESQVQK